MKRSTRSSRHRWGRGDEGAVTTVKRRSLQLVGWLAVVGALAAGCHEQRSEDDLGGSVLYQVTYLEWATLWLNSSYRWNRPDLKTFFLPKPPNRITLHVGHRADASEALLKEVEAHARDGVAAFKDFQRRYRGHDLSWLELDVERSVLGSDP